MHEFGIVEPLLKAALKAAEAQGGHAIEEVRVRIGRLRQVKPEALAVAFNALTAGTAAEGATFVWEEIPPRVRCRACQAIFQPKDDWFWPCPECDASGGQLLEGNELLLQRVVLQRPAR
jgi:hydrogenase nickel incorporation protein HypA/HybF